MGEEGKWMRSFAGLLVVMLVFGVQRRPEDVLGADSEAVTGKSAAGEGLSPSVAGPAARPGSGREAMSWATRVRIEQAVAAIDPRYAPQPNAAGLRLSAGGVVATSSGSGARLALSEGEETLFGVSGIGREGALARLAEAAEAVVAGPRIEIERGRGVVEWWRALPSGLEHGLTLASRPPGVGELVVEVALGDELSARGVSEDEVELRDASGRVVARYSHLLVLDADGEEVPARMQARDQVIALVTDDSDARYPLVVDPLLVAAEEARLRAPDGTPDWFGHSLSLSADGSRALVGAYGDDTPGSRRRLANAGSARVFLRTGTSWAQEATLLAPDGAVGDWFGYSVSLSADGSRALVGAFRDDTGGRIDAGSSHVFLRSGASWTHEATLLAPDGAPFDYFGSSVSLSADGGRALVGVISDNTPGGTNTGSARVFRRSATTWTQEATLLAPDGAPSDQFGGAVSLSADGRRALVGARGDDTTAGRDAGSAGVFRRSGTRWVHEAALLAPDGGFFGDSVSLSADGRRALVGAFRDVEGPNAGRARVFRRSGRSWTLEAPLRPPLRPPDGERRDWFGYSTSLSADGSRALVSDGWRGTLVFQRSGRSWTPEATVERFAHSVSLSADGSRALVGIEVFTLEPGASAGQ